MAWRFREEVEGEVRHRILELKLPGADVCPIAPPRTDPVPSVVVLCVGGLR